MLKKKTRSARALLEAHLEMEGRGCSVEDTLRLTQSVREESEESATSLDPS